jgi:hypothetical protein
MKNLGNKRATTHLMVAFFAIMLFFQVEQCQAVASNKRRNAAAFVVPSSLSAAATRRMNHNNNDLQRISMLPPTTSSMAFFDSASSFLASSTLEQAVDSTIIPQQLQESTNNLPPIIIEQQSPTTTLIVFIIGIIPFIWATIEFWRRIAVGATFGTGSDSVVIPSPFDNTKDDDGLISIGEDGNPMSSRGRRTLDRGALTVAYVLFGVAAFSVGIAVASVIMGPKPDDIMMPL